MAAGREVGVAHRGLRNPLGRKASRREGPLEAQFMLFSVALLVAKAELRQEKCPAEPSVGGSSCEPSKGGRPLFKLVQVPFRTEQASNEGPSESSNYFRYRGAAQRKSMRILVKTQINSRRSQAALRKLSDR